MSNCVEIIAGVNGLCLSVNNRRVAGPKPWGGGTVIAQWTVADEAINNALAVKITNPQPKANNEK